MDSGMLNSCIELRSALAKSLDEYNDEEKKNLSLVFEEDYRGKMTTHDLVDHFEKATQRRGLDGDESVQELICALKTFSKRHRDLIKGVVGEQWALRATRALRVPHVKISNLEIEHNGRHCECDQVIFTEYGIFVIEVKNLAGEVLIDSHGLLRHARNDYAPGYGIGARCLEKEALVWETLVNGGFEGVKRTDIHSILLFVNRNSEIRDDFDRIKICRQDDVCYHIQDFSSGSATFNTEELARMGAYLVGIHSPEDIDHLEEFSFLRPESKPSWALSSSMTNQI